MRPIAPPEPEPAAATYFHPVPMGPVFGPRSEQPDGVEAESTPLFPEQFAPRPLAPQLLPIPQSESGELNPGGDLPPPSADESNDGDDEGLPESDGPAAARSAAGRGQLRFPATAATATVTGWRIAKLRRGRDSGVGGQGGK